jgi:hypothetical protein
MIRIVGPLDTSEYEAALALRSLITQAWPNVAQDAIHNIQIIAGAKCHGQLTRDIDLLLLGNFGAGLTYTPFLPFETPDGQIHLPDAVEVRNLCLVIEIKGHRPEDVRFVGTTAKVRYKEKWHNASEQNEKQVFAVKNYIEYHGIQPPRITPLLWLRNVPNTALPPRPHPIIGAQITWGMILNVIGQITPPRWRDGHWVIGADQNPVILPRMVELFTKILEPTRLDRQRMERINQQNVDIASIQQVVGKKLVILRGRGGTGKTMHLLQLAKRLYDEQGARILILTYNKALVADIRRLLTILGIADDESSSTIHIQTVHSFLYSVLVGLGIINHGFSTFLESYEHLKDEALEFLMAGAVSLADLEELVTTDSEVFSWDYIFIDEGQDWPSNERDLLLHLYSSSQLMVADGIDQLVRRNTPLDWRKGLKHSESQVLPLKKTLRMKAGLARFVSAVARHLGLLYSEWEANEEIPGGHVIIVEGSYFQNKDLHERLLRANARDGNYPIDILFCVPPNLVSHLNESKATRSAPATIFEQWGFSTWDGASEDVRDGYPTDTDQLRIVQYESCRGLEGWVVVNLGLDRFYSLKLSTFRDSKLLSTATRPGSIGSDTSAAQAQAARWLLIPLTRAMDTLVIQLDSKDSSSPLYKALRSAAAEYADYVEWISVR